MVFSEQAQAQRGINGRVFSDCMESHVYVYHHESFRINSSLSDSNKRNQTGEIVGGEDRIDTKREYFAGDNFIVNFGNEHWKTVNRTRKRTIT